MVMISLSASPACGPRFLAGWASWFSSRACQCGLKAWQKSSNWQKSSTSRSNIDASPPLMVPTQEEECRGDKGLASPQTRNSGGLVLQPGFYVRLKKSQTESIAGLYGHALPAPANMLISYMANRKPGCSTSLWKSAYTALDRV